MVLTLISEPNGPHGRPEYKDPRNILPYPLRVSGQDHRKIALIYVIVGSLSAVPPKDESVSSSTPRLARSTSGVSLRILSNWKMEIQH